MSANEVWILEQWKILLICQGEGMLLLEEESVPLSRGQVWVLSEKRKQYNIHWNKETKEKHFLLSTDLLKKYSTKNTDFTLLTQEQVNLLTLNEEQTMQLEELFGKVEEGAQGFGADVREQLYQVEVLLFLTPLFLKGRETTFLKPSGVNQRITPILQYVEENMAEPLTLDHIATHFFLSKHYLCRLFKEQTGTTVVEYLLQCRIAKACLLLQQGHSVQRSGELSGFSDNSHFIRTFRGRMGTSPGRYGKEYGKKSQKIETRRRGYDEKE